jgi:hypothetical protein
MPFASITPEEAKAILKELSTTNISELSRELARRGTPVTVGALRTWKKRKWRSSERQIAGQKNIKQQTALGEAISVATRVGMPDDVLSAMYETLKALSDGDLVVSATRDLYIYGSLMLAQTRYASDYLLRTNPDALARLLIACLHLIEGGSEKIREARRLAAMSERGYVEPQTIDATAQEVSSPSPAVEPAAPPRVIPFGNLARELRLIASTPDSVAEVVVPPKANGNGRDH